MAPPYSSPYRQISCVFDNSSRNNVQERLQIHVDQAFKIDHIVSLGEEGGDHDAKEPAQAEDHPLPPSTPLPSEFLQVSRRHQSNGFPLDWRRVSRGFARGSAEEASPESRHASGKHLLRHALIQRRAAHLKGRGFNRFSDISCAKQAPTSSHGPLATGPRTGTRTTSKAKVSCRNPERDARIR